MEDSILGSCWKCHAKLGESDYGRRSQCPRCGYDARTCRNCSFFSSGSHNDCREPQAERVVDKEKSVFCDYFRPHTHGDGAVGGAGAADDPFKAAEALFRK